MKLYLTPHSTFSRRIRIALHEKGLSAEEIEAVPEERAKSWYRAINPYGRIPALVDGDVVVYESTAVLDYLERRFPEVPLVSSDPGEHARTVMYVKLCDLEFTPYAVAIQWPRRSKPEGPWDGEAMARARQPVVRHYEILERELEGRDYLVGDRFSWADLAYVPFLHFHALLDVELPPSIAAWWERLGARESVRATVPAI